MARTYRNLIYSTAEYTKSYQGFRGVELNASSSITDSSRLAYAENMYRDYDADGADAIESVPGFRKLFSCEKSIHALYYQPSSSAGDHLIIHAADSLYRYPIGNIDSETASLEEAIAQISDTKSFGFQFGRYFYIIDGNSILRIDEDGACKTVSDEDATPYVPTTYVSGEKYEERNLLTDLFKEEYYVVDPTGFYYSTDGLKYTINDATLRYCSVSGINDDESGEISIPAYVDISGVEYKVTQIEPYAFSKNTTITSVSISEGITKIGLFAFKGCSGITKVIIPASVTHIENGAFMDCSNLEMLYLGDGISDIGIASFSGCTKLENIYYPFNEEGFKEILNIEGLSGKSVTFETRHEAITLAFALHDKTESVSKALVNGEEHEFVAEIKSGDVKLLTMHFDSLSDATGIKVEIYGKLSAVKPNFNGEGDVKEGNISGHEAISGCKTAEAFDGKIFLSGNPALPNTVFYAEGKDSDSGVLLYVGKYNYFNDGVGGYKVKRMLAVRDMLAVFKEGDDGSGSIFYHKKEQTNSDAVSTIYPVAYVHSGICSAGAAHSFLDDPVFITNEGLFALDGQNINYQRNIACRSHNVNFKLLKEDLKKTYLCTWLGYLVVGCGKNIYLADSRALFNHSSGNREYEWFFLTDIGTYKEDNPVYRYSYEASDGTVVNTAKCGETADYKNVFSEMASDGSIHYYTQENGVKYSVHSTDERSGGEFFPATVFISHGKHLFFATDNGDVCVFNNDKRGVPPKELTEAEGFDPVLYASEMADKIHPAYYSFAGHAPKYEIRTALDNCQIPHLTKNTIKKSLVIKARSYASDNIKCEVVTDKGDTTNVGYFPTTDVGFDNFSFDSAPWNTGKYTSSALPEKEKRWIEKQIVLSSTKYCAPISVYSISYRYGIKGKIKNNT